MWWWWIALGWRARVRARPRSRWWRTLGAQDLRRCDLRRRRGVVAQRLACYRRRLLLVVEIDVERLRDAARRAVRMIEAKRRVTDLDLIAVREREWLVLDVAVDERAVAGAAIDHDPRALLVPEVEVLARHRDIGQHDVVIDRATDGVIFPRNDLDLLTAVIAGDDHQPGEDCLRRDDRERCVRALIVDGGLVEDAVRGRGDVGDVVAAARQPQGANLLRNFTLLDGRTGLFLPARLDRGLLVLVVKMLGHLRHHVRRYALWRP